MAAYVRLLQALGSLRQWYGSFVRDYPLVNYPPRKASVASCKPQAEVDLHVPAFHAGCATFMRP